MSKFNDAIGFLKGIRVLQECLYRHVPTPEVNSKLFKNACQNTSHLSKVMINNRKYVYDGSLNIFHQVVSIAQYKLSNKTTYETKSNKKTGSSKHENSINELDALDIQLLAEFREKYPEIVKKKEETNKININKTKEMKSKLASINLNEKQKLKLDFPNSERPNIKLSQRVGHERRVPSSEIERGISFATLFAKLSASVVWSKTKQSFGFDNKHSGQSFHLSDANLERIVAALCKVRGAALKLGQMLSIQDSGSSNPRIAEIFERVRQSADFMPTRQMHKVMAKHFNSEWRKYFLEFDEKPFAAASIGQVHRGIRSAGGEVVAVKVQYPGVRQSIDSDINNLMSLMQLVKIFPPGLYVEKAIEVIKRELYLECDYKREAEYSEYFRKEFLNDSVFKVPKVFYDFTSTEVLTTEFVDGVPIDHCLQMSQEIRDWVGTHMLRLCLLELFHFRTMQTDPNWSNFLFDFDKEKIYLIDFGASRKYSQKFIDEYLRVIKAASIHDREGILHHSRNLGFLTGFETKVMEDAHIDAVSILGEIFTSNEPFDFGKQSTTRRILRLIPIMLEHRLTSPPEESYSLHRKLSGGFLLCSRLKSRVSCKILFDSIYNNYQFL